MGRAVFMGGGRVARAIAAAVLASVAAPAAHAAATYALAASATIISKSSCKFTSAAGSILGFGTIDPSSAVDATASVNLALICQGSATTATYVVTANNGLHGTGPAAPRMQHATNLTAFLPYALNVPVSGTIPKGVATTVTINGTITPANFGSAISGAYSDTVVLSITP